MLVLFTSTGSFGYMIGVMINDVIKWAIFYVIGLVAFAAALMVLYRNERAAIGVPFWSARLPLATYSATLALAIRTTRTTSNIYTSHACHHSCRATMLAILGAIIAAVLATIPTYLPFSGRWRSNALTSTTISHISPTRVSFYSRLLLTAAATSTASGHRHAAATRTRAAWPCLQPYGHTFYIPPKMTLGGGSRRPSLARCCTCYIRFMR